MKHPAEYDEATTRALSLWVILSRAHTVLERKIAEDIQQHGFTPTEFGVLECLYHKGPQTQASLGEAILITSGNVTYVVDKLVASGLAIRRPCAEDRRIVYADITDKGRRLMAEIFPKHARRIRQLVGILDPDEQDRLRNLVRKLGHGIKEMEE